MYKQFKYYIAFLLLLTLSACAPPAAAPATTPSSNPGAVVPSATTASKDARPNITTLRLAGGTDWGYPSPFLFSRGPGFIHSLYIFDTLVWKDAKGNYIPWLAE
ncbi:MAG: hypothetical protein LC737_03680 [Chloroflexi bacterium]|nr:hypothetical protein [Chloroflexota bacterium]